MIPREEIDQQYLDQATQLESDFFNIVDEGLPTQYRVLKDDGSIDTFNQLHAQIWIAHEAALIAAGHQLPPEPPPPLTPDEIRARELLGTSPQAITMPEMWELLRIIGRRLGLLG